MRSLLKSSVSRIGLLAALSPLLSMAHAQTPDPAPQAEEIVVTASKRSTSLQRSPQSVAVLNGETQRDRGQQRLEDIQVSVPNVSFTNTSNSSQLFIRGVGNTFINAGGDPGVAFYQDGAYVSDARTSNTSMFDVARVEILRGPQGALYGRNAVGGAINIISAKPSDVLEGRIDALVGDYGRFESEGFITGPIGEGGVTGRLSYQLRKLDGYTRNLLAGRPGAPDRLDDLDSLGLRGQLASALPGGGEISLLVSYYREDEAGPALGIVSIPGVIYPTQAIFGLVPTNDPRAVNANVGALDLEVSTANLNVTQPLGENTLTVVANYRNGRQNFLNDCDGTEAEGCRYSTYTTSEDYFLEAYLASPSDDRLRWIIGASYTYFDQYQNVQVPWQTQASFLVPGVPTNIPFFIHYNGGGNLYTESFAAYADLRYQLNDVWALSAQARYSVTTKRSDEYQFIPSFGVGVTDFQNRLEDTHTPFKVGIEGQFTPDILVYASYATGNKDGAINIGALQSSLVRPEEVRTLELGAKVTVLDGRLRLNGAIFHSTYEDLQIAQVVGTVAALANAPESTIDGAELEVTIFPAEGLRLGISLGYLDGRFDAFSNSKTLPGLLPGPLTDLSGNRLPYVPEFTANLDAQYEFALAEGYRASLGIQYSWRSRIYFNEFNERDNGQGPGGVLNLSASFSPDDGPWRLYGYVNNVLDRTYQVGSTIYSGLLGAEKAINYAPPRHFGIGVSLTF